MAKRSSHFSSFTLAAITPKPPVATDSWWARPEMRERDVFAAEWRAREHSNVPHGTAHKDQERNEA